MTDRLQPPDAMVVRLNAQLHPPVPYELALYDRHGLRLLPGDLPSGHRHRHDRRHHSHPHGHSGHQRVHLLRSGHRINLCQRYPESQLEELRRYIGGAARFWIERVYGEKMVASAGPERMRHLEQVMANDGHLAELARQARATMAEPARG